MFDPYSFYNGFSIKTAVGNNFFSFKQRTQKEIFVPPLVSGSPKDLSIGDRIAFSEIVDGIEQNFCGLKEFIHYNNNGTEVFIFDNHNHAFFFWLYAYNKGLIKFGEKLVHVDQHTDMRKPDKWFSKNKVKNAAQSFDYTNYYLNVGNFIQPALKLGLFNSVDIIDSSRSFEKTFNNNIVLDIDIDVFSDDMNYIADSLKISKINEYAKKAKFITLATSPFFIDQQKAIHIIQEMF